MKNHPILTVLLLPTLLAGCGNERTVLGNFRLELWEDGQTYYLHQKGQADDSLGGSIIGGTVLRLGWGRRFILAERHSISRGDPDGWMIIDTQTRTITGPLAEAELRSRPEAQGIQILKVEEAWQKL